MHLSYKCLIAWVFLTHLFTVESELGAIHVRRGFWIVSLCQIQVRIMPCIERHFPMVGGKTDCISMSAYLKCLLSRISCHCVSTILLDQAQMTCGEGGCAPSPDSRERIPAVDKFSSAVENLNNDISRSAPLGYSQNYRLYFVLITSVYSKYYQNPRGGSGDIVQASRRKKGVKIICSSLRSSR